RLAAPSVDAALTSETPSASSVHPLPPVSHIEPTVAERPDPVANPDEEIVHEVRSPEPASALESTAPAPVPLKLDWPSDLVQIETDPDKVRTAQQTVPQEADEHRVKRVRASLPPVSHEPLIQVETRNVPGNAEAGVAARAPADADRSTASTPN
ncbi:MAG: hypothetical protein OEZ08_12300, partial [Betaproteobacteria bacterium]|nr:hypothetical protein [Betaproteobacteria bacterium]